MATMRYELRGGTSALQMIYCVVSHGKNKDRISTGIKVMPKQWSVQKVKNHPNSLEINKKLLESKHQVEDIILKITLDNPPITFDKLKKELDLLFRTSNPEKSTMVTPKYKAKAVIPTNLLDFTAYFIKKIQSDISLTGKKLGEGTIKNYKVSYNHLKKFCKSRNLDSSFEKIDSEFITGFRTYLTIDANMRLNSASRHIKVLKTLLNEAAELGANKNTAFRTYKSMKNVTEKADNIYLTEADIAKMYALDLSDDWRLQNVRDWFVIACEMGLRYSDWQQIDLSKIQNDKIEFFQTKTGDRAVIPLNLTQYFWQIVKRRGGQLPKVYTNQECNRSLKNIAKLADISTLQTITYTKAGERKVDYIAKYDMISTHTARRTFATNMFLKGMPISLIMSITGHKTEQAFLIYVKAGVDEKAEMMDNYIAQQKDKK